MRQRKWGWRKREGKGGRVIHADFFVVLENKVQVYITSDFTGTRNNEEVVAEKGEEGPTCGMIC